MTQEFLVSTDWLAKRLDDPGIRVVDCRFGFDRDYRTDYEASHIPGAVYVDWSKDLTDPDHEVEGMIAPAEQIAEVMGRLGIDDETMIVAYDQEGGHYSARLWLVLARYGHGHQVRILNGGWTAWTQENRPTTGELPPTIDSAGRFTMDPARFQPELVADWRDVLEAAQHATAVVLDVRRWSEFTGEEARARRGGRIPNARYAFWQDNLRWETDRRFRSPDDLADRARAAGADHSTPVITYCQGGVRAAHAAIALKMAGFENVRVYDGSWAEWGNREDLPIETGEPEGKDRT